VTIEIFVLKSKKILEITIAAISGVLWIFFINLRFFDLPNIWVITIQFVTTIYTIIIGLLSQYLAS
jgi:ABC-type tungstate transport system substrate-binding protein